MSAMKAHLITVMRYRILLHMQVAHTRHANGEGDLKMAKAANWQP